MNRLIDVAILVNTCICMMLGTWCIYNPKHTYIYPFAIPFPIILLLCLVSCIIAVCNDTLRAGLIRNGFLALSVIAYIFTVYKWPGSDDGPGMALVWIVGPFFILEMYLGVISTVFIFKER